MTYDDADGVRALATEQRFDIELVFMKNTHHTKMTELLVGRDLDWVRDKELSLFDQEAVRKQSLKNKEL